MEKGEIVKKTSVKSKLSQLNDRRFYFPDGIISLPFCHPNLKEIDEFKKEKGQKIEKYFWEEKEHLFNLELKALKNHPSLYLYNQILMSVPKLFNIGQKNDFMQQKKTLLKRSTKDIILEGGWITKWTIQMMLNLKGIFWLWEQMGVVKLPLFKIWEKIRCLGTLKKCYGYQKWHILLKENNIRGCFVNEHVDFQYPNDIDEFEDLLEICQRKKTDCKENVLRRKYGA